MKKATVAIAKVIIPSTRVTAVYDEELVAQLKESMRALGVLTPIVCVKVGEEYLLVDGLHRLQELKDQGVLMVDLVYTEGDAKDNLLQNLVLNRVRGKVKASEMVAVIGALERDYGMDSEAIGKKTGFGRDYVEKYISVAKASPSVVEALNLGVIEIGHAYELSRLPSRAQQEEVMAKYQVWRWKIPELKAQVDNILTMMREVGEQRAAAAAKEKPEPPAFYCAGCETRTDPRQLRAVSLCPDCFGFVWRAKHSPPVETTVAPKDGGGV